MNQPAAAGTARYFAERFGYPPHGTWFAPGRVNLLGGPDYNEVFVLPFALSAGVFAAASRRSDRRIALTSRQAGGEPVLLDIDTLEPGSAPGWAAYPAGVAWALRQAGYLAGGADIAIDADLPAGAGLSSSAALECAVALALTELYQVPVPRRELAALARRAENDFAGVPTGIMDQTAALLGQAGHALLLDCRSLDHSQVPFDPAAAGSRLLLINTRARHDLSDGGYGRRRAECEEAARLLGVSSLRDITDAADTARLADPVLRRRARHVVTDNQRVLQVTGLLRGSPEDRPDTYREIGRLLTQAHSSLRDDFEISWPEADAAVEAALAAGALGARMMGGGFGGCVLALVPEAASGPVRGAVSEAYAQHGWTAPEFLDAVPSDHARRLALPGDSGVTRGLEPPPL